MTTYPDVEQELKSKTVGVELLHGIDEYDGTATLSELKLWCEDWDTPAIDYRSDILRELGLISVTVLNQDEPGKTQRQFRLNEKGEIVYEEWCEQQGEPEVIEEDDEASFTVAEKRDVMEMMRQQEEMQSQVDTLETDVLDLEEYMYEWHESAEQYLRAIRTVVEDKLGISLESYLETGESDTIKQEDQ